MARSAKTNTTPRSAMNKRLPAAAGAALMLALSGCSIPNVSIQTDTAKEAEAQSLELEQPEQTSEQEPEQQSERNSEQQSLPAWLLDDFPVEVDVDGITFRMPEEGNGWEAPDYSEGVDGPSVSVHYQPPEQDSYYGNWGAIHLWKLGPSSSTQADFLGLGTDLPDTDYINAMMDHFRKTENDSVGEVFKSSQWKVSRDPGGVVCSCLYSRLLDPMVVGAEDSYLTTGVQAYIFTDHGTYWFNCCYTIRDVDSHKDEDVEMLLSIPLTLWAGKNS